MIAHAGEIFFSIFSVGIACRISNILVDNTIIKKILILTLLIQFFLVLVGDYWLSHSIKFTFFAKLEVVL